MSKLLVSLCALVMLLAGCAAPARQLAHLEDRAKPIPQPRRFPPYPAGARTKKVQGSVLVCFTVKPDGSVYQPYIKSASSPKAKKYLGKAALDVISKWKFYPRVVAGVPMATSDVCQTISFRIR